MGAGKPMSFWLLVCLFVCLCMPWRPVGKLRSFIVTFALGSLAYLTQRQSHQYPEYGSYCMKILLQLVQFQVGWGGLFFGSPRFHNRIVHCSPFKASKESALITFYRLKGEATSSIVSYIWKPCGPCQAILLVKCRQCNAKISGAYVRGVPERNERMGPREAGSHQQCFISLCAERLANILYERVTGRHYKHCLSLE